MDRSGLFAGKRIDNSYDAHCSTGLHIFGVQNPAIAALSRGQNQGIIEGILGRDMDVHPLFVELRVRIDLTEGCKNGIQIGLGILN